MTDTSILHCTAKKLNVEYSVEKVTGILMRVSTKMFKKSLEIRIIVS